MNILTQEELQQRAPSIFALEPYQKMSDRYRFVPTIQVVNALRDNNFFPVYAGQSKTKIEGRGEFMRHVVRFRLANNLVATTEEEIPELVLINSHDGSSSYKLMMGIFRIVCSNGLVVCTGSMSEICLRHQGSRSLPQQAIDASYQIINDAPAVIKAVGDWKSIQLTDQQQVAYATAALQLRDSSLVLQPYQILQYRRYEDKQPTLWNTFNRVQENFIKGGNRGVNATGRKMKTRSIKSVTEDLRINRALWKLTEEMGKIVKKEKTLDNECALC